VAFFYEQCSEKPCAVAHCSRAKRRTVDSLTPSTSAVVFTKDTIGSGKRACSTAFIGPLCFSCLANVWIDIFCATEESVTQIIASAEKNSHARCFYRTSLFRLLEDIDNCIFVVIKPVSTLAAFHRFDACGSKLASQAPFGQRLAFNSKPFG